MYSSKEFAEKYLDVVSDFESYEGVKPPIVDYLLLMPVNGIHKVEMLYQMIFATQDNECCDTVFELANAHLTEQAKLQLEKLFELMQVACGFEMAS